ncbi:metal-dependent hydrolase [Sporolactobacillus sp. THM7-7]|nr:metal-dependent hydrolase [Sporolactobacillus sp. THM7-7]
MDSATHVVMGLGLAGLATLDPAISSDPAAFQAVMLGTVIGSSIPDIDASLKLKSNAMFIRNHRGMTHSLPATLLWPLAITSCLLPIFPEANITHLLSWTLLAVFLHVFVDIFNAYGTQAVRPFTGKWIAFGIINIFDPFIFSLHLMGLVLWQMGANPGVTFAVIYAILAAYYVWRTVYHHRTIRRIKEELPGVKKVYLSPTLRWSHYHMAAESSDRFYVGKIEGTKLNLIDTFDRRPIDFENAIVKAAVRDKNVRAFLSLSPIYRWKLMQQKGRYVLQFVDLRYFAKGTYPFTATVWLSKDLSVQSSFTGWVYSERKLKKKMAVAQSKS